MKIRMIIIAICIIGIAYLAYTHFNKKVTTGTREAQTSDNSKELERIMKKGYDREEALQIMNSEGYKDGTINY